MSNDGIIKLPERIKKLDDVLNRAVNANDHATSLITALHLIRFCNKAAIDTIFPSNSICMSAPWEVAAQVSVSLYYSNANQQIHHNTGLTLFPVYLGTKSLGRAAQLLSLAQQYLTDVVSKVLAVSNNNNNSPSSSSSSSSLLPPPGSDCQRLATAWPFIVTLSHQGIVAFYGGRQRLALGYVEAAISMVKNTLGIYNENTLSATSSASASPQRKQRSQSPPLIVIPVSSTENNNEKHQKDNETDVGKMTSRASIIGNANLANLRSAAVKLTTLMNGSKECAIQLIVLLLNYSRILVSLKKYSHARDSAAVAKLMLEDLQDVEFAKATQVLAEVAMNESQDWPSILNGRTNLPLLQSFCSYTLADVDVLCRPTSVQVLEKSLLMFRDADLAAAAAELGTGNGYRKMILEKAKMVAEQLDLVQQTLVKEVILLQEQQHHHQHQDDYSSAVSSSHYHYYIPESIQNSMQKPQFMSPLPRNPKDAVNTTLSSMTRTASSSSSSSSGVSKNNNNNSYSSSTANILKNSLIQRMRRGNSSITTPLNETSSGVAGGRVHHQKSFNTTPIRVGYRAFEAKTQKNTMAIRSSRSSSGVASTILTRNGSAGGKTNHNKKVHFIGSRSPSPF